MNYFRKNNSNVYVMLLDATQAFDNMNYVKLFYQLIDRGLNPFIIRCLLYMYTHQCLNVSWNNSQSKYFSTTNGVKQGGVLSPILLFSLTRRNVNLSNMANPMMYPFISMER